MAAVRSPLSEIKKEQQSNANAECDSPDEINTEETIRVMNELSILLQKTNNAKEMQKIRQKAARTRELCNVQAKDAKLMIRDMTSHLDNLENELVSPPSDELRSKQLFDIEKNKQHTLDSIASLENEINHCETKVNKLSESKKVAKQQFESLEQCQESKALKIESSFGLYSSITGIRWDYSNVDTIAGVVQSETEIRSFNFDPREMSDYELSEALWDVIDPQ